MTLIKRFSIPGLMAVLTMIAALAGAASPAAAQSPAVAESPTTLQTSAPARSHNAVSIHLPAVGDTGIAMQYERFVLPDRWSLAATVSLRSSASGDYDSWTTAGGLELHYWFRGRSLRSSLTRSMVGWHAGARLALSRTSLSSEQKNADIGSMISVSGALVGGYRFAMWRRVELTPSLGLGVRTDVDPAGVVPPRTRGVVTLGTTLGWMF